MSNCRFIIFMCFVCVTVSCNSQMKYNVHTDSGGYKRYNLGNSKQITLSVKATKNVIIKLCSGENKYLKGIIMCEVEAILKTSVKHGISGSILQINKEKKAISHGNTDITNSKYTEVRITWYNKHFNLVVNNQLEPLLTHPLPIDQFAHLVVGTEGGKPADWILSDNITSGGISTSANYSFIILITMLAAYYSINNC